MSRVIPEEGDKGRGEPAPDHHQGPAELSTRRWYPEQPYPSRPDNSMGRIKKWPLPRIIVIDSSHIADFNPIPPDILSSPICSASIPPIITDATPSTGGTSPIFSPITINVGPSIAAPQQGNPGRPDQPQPQAEVSQAADCAENSPQRPSFGQTGQKALFP